MKRSILRWLFLTIAVLTLSLSNFVQGQGLLDQGKNLSGGGSGGGTAGIAGALPLDKITSLLKQQGYSNITGIGPASSGNALQAFATNSAGKPMKLLINPSTGRVISALAK